MENPASALQIGIVLLSSELQVIGLNDFARGVFGAAAEELGKDLLSYHPARSRERVRGLIHDMTHAPPGEARTVVIDVTGRAIVTNLSRLAITSPVPQACWAVTFFDVTVPTGAAKNPLSGLVEMKKVPVADGGSCRFLALDEVYAIRSDGDYCRIFTATASYYQHLSLKTFLLRYPSSTLFRVHKSHVVNLRHIRKTLRTGKDQLRVLFDSENIPPIPVSRRRVAELKQALAQF